VLRHLDPHNAKAQFRRAVANKAFGKLEEAVRDLETVLKLDPKKAEVKAELDDCKRLLAQQKPVSKIQEVGETEVAEQSQEEVKEVPRKAKQMKNLQQEIIDKASEIA